MELKHIGKVYHNRKNDVVVFHDISLKIDYVGIILLLGESGSGKTTLLNIMSELDQDITGECIVNGEVEYIKQEIDLIDSMSVLDNIELGITHDERLEVLLKKADLFDEKDKKVKFLSIGQKRRVQILRTLMRTPSIIFCDEPTASLDQENVEIIMKLIQEASSHIPIIIATHDERLSEYATNSFLIQNKELMETHHAEETKTSKLIQSNSSKKLNFMKKVSFSISYLCSRPLELFSSLFMIFLLVFSLYGGVQMFQDVEDKALEKEIWSNGNNIISAVPKEAKLYEEDNPEFGYIYREYDLYNQDDLSEIKKNIPSIIGYEWGWNDYDFTSFPTIAEKNEGKKFRSYLIEDFSYKETHTEEIDMAGYVLPLTNSLNIEPYETKNQATVFQIYDFNQIPLYIGDYPESSNEAVIDYGFAQYLQKYFKSRSMNDLLQRNLTLYTYSPTPFKEETKITFVISGIANTNNENIHHIYYRAGDYDKVLSQTYDFISKKPRHTVLNLLCTPDADISSITETLNESFKQEHNVFMTPLQTNEHRSKYFGSVTGSTNVELESYKDPDVFDVYFIIIFITILLAYVFLIYMKRMRLHKEYQLLSHYGYSTYIFILINTLILFSLNALMIFFILPWLFEQCNKIFHRLQFTDIFMVSTDQIIITILLSFAILYIIQIIQAFVYKRIYKGI